jgi:hypothetical protein
MPIGLKGNTDGSGAIQIGGSDAISISTGLNTTFAGTITATGTVAGTTGTLYPLVSGTAVSATGTAVDFTGIPSWAKRITVMLSGVSTNGTSNWLIQLGDSGGIEVTGYDSGVSFAQTGNLTGAANSTAGLLLTISFGAAQKASGQIILTKIDGNTWVSSVTLGTDTTYNYFGGGTKTLSDTLTQVRITTVNGTDTFDAGSINILYE